MYILSIHKDDLIKHPDFALLTKMPETTEDFTQGLGARFFVDSDSRCYCLAGEDKLVDIIKNVLSGESASAEVQVKEFNEANLHSNYTAWLREYMARRQRILKDADPESMKILGTDLCSKSGCNRKPKYRFERRHPVAIETDDPDALKYRIAYKVTTCGNPQHWLDAIHLSQHITHVVDLSTGKDVPDVLKQYEKLKKRLGDRHL